MRFLFATLTTLAFVLGTSHAAKAQNLTLDTLQEMTQDQLNTIYEAAQPGSIPNGASDGRAIFFAGSLLTDPAAILASLIWQGKVFDRDNGVLLNKVFGFNLIKAKVFYGESLLDGKESIIIDYHHTSTIAKPVRDEIRLVGPDLYLGRAYIQTWIGDYMAVNFALDFADAKQE